MSKSFKTPEQYLESIRDGRIVYADGEKITDVTTHPITSKGALSYAREYQRFHDPELRPIFTATDTENEELADLFLVPPSSSQDLLRRAKALEMAHDLQYGSSLALSDGLLSLYMAAGELAKANPQYKGNIDAMYRRFRWEDLTMAIAMSDTKGDRSKHPSEQEDPDMYVRKVAERDDGIVIRGMKAHISGAPFVHELVVMPTKRMLPNESDYSVTCLVSPGAPGVKLVMRPRRMTGSRFEYPLSYQAVGHDCFVWFDDVFVPWERVIQNGEEWVSSHIVRALGILLRYSELCGTKHYAQLLTGAAYLMAQYNGVEKASHVKDHLFELAMWSSALEAFVTTAALTCTMEDGMAVPNGVIANIGKYMFTDRLSEVYKRLIDIGGAIITTQPWESDYRHPDLHHAFQKYLNTGARATAEQRLRLTNFIRDLVADEYAGHFLVTHLHGAGSPQSQKIVTRKEYDFERAAEKVRRLAGLED